MIHESNVPRCRDLRAGEVLDHNNVKTLGLTKLAHYDGLPHGPCRDTGLEIAAINVSGNITDRSNADRTGYAQV